MPDSALTSKISFLIASLNRQLEREIEESVRPLKLPIEQVRVIEALSSASGARGLKMSELASLVAVDASTLTKVVERMVSDSLVYRASDPSDRRTVKVLITPKGAALFKTLRPLLENQERELLQSFGALANEGEVVDLVRILAHLQQRTAMKEDRTTL